MNRPNFEDIKTYEEFKKYYWYREELQSICKNLGLEYDCGKVELNEIIRLYFDGVKIAHKPRKTKKSVGVLLTLDTSLVGCGFSFGPKFRDFYAKITGDDNFKFTADMVSTAKAVKNADDSSFTLGDLLDIKYGKKTYAVYDKSACQWNKFLKDFCEDPINRIYPDKLKAASKFWKLLRESDLPKEYSRQFVENNRNAIED